MTASTTFLHSHHVSRDSARRGFRTLASAVGIALAMTACAGGDGVAGDGGNGEGASGGSSASGGSGGAGATGGIARPDRGVPELADAAFLASATVSKRVGLPLSGQGTILDATALANQLAGYDPGSLLRCSLGGQVAYDEAIDALGGVTWGYSVHPLEDQSQPRIYAGFENVQRYYDGVPGAGATTDANGASPVEIALPDIVAVTESAALFYSPSHGILVVNVTDGEPTFECATQLPGRPDQFFFHEGHLVAMIGAQGRAHSSLLHFQLSGTALRFVESVDLGQVSILDSRRFNDKLVFYTDLRLEPTAPAQNPQAGVGAGAGVPNDLVDGPIPSMVQPEHRSLRVFTLGDTLREEMHDTLIDTTLAESELVSERVTPETPADTLIHEARRFGRGMWASDRYFVVTEQVDETYLSSWQSRSYSRCAQSHTVETPYEYCWTRYETRPNPEYVEPDNSGGDRSCQGVTLSDCLVQVARVSNETIQVPVGRECEPRVRRRWVCDATEQVTTEYPVFRSEQKTQLYIYEYGDAGFVRVDGAVHEITTPGLESESPDAQVDVLTTSAETFDLAVPGAVQTLRFQNGFLYVISRGVLQVYALGGSSIVRTSTLPVVNETLQSALFSSEQIILSDFGWSGGDHSTLRVVNLDNPAFPVVEASTHSLPGGHRSILPSAFGVFTIGSVDQFQGQTLNAIKLGLFSDPFVEEKAYLILATDLPGGAFLGAEEAQAFNSAEQRLLLPYSGRDEPSRNVFRVGVSHLESDAIVSEGAVVVPEGVQRVRPLVAGSESYLSFANNSIEWLTPDAGQWQAAPILEYFQPSYVYRLTDEDDYAELQRLGDRCKLYFANASAINQRSTGTYSEEFDCYGGYPTGFANILLFAEGGIEFYQDDASLRVLSDAEVAMVRDAIAERPICVLSLELVDNVYVAPNAIPADAEATCMSPAEYQRRRNELINAAE